MQPVELGAQLGEVLFVHQLLDQRTPRHFLPPDEVLHQGMAMQKLPHFAQVLLQVLDFQPCEQFGH